MSDNLDNLRNEINELDKELLSILKKRMNVSIKIGNYKKENNIQVLNSNREKEVINNLLNLNNENEIILEKEFIITVWQLLMNYSKKIQV